MESLCANSQTYQAATVLDSASFPELISFPGATVLGSAATIGQTRSTRNRRRTEAIILHEKRRSVAPVPSSLPFVRDTFSSTLLISACVKYIS
jgi:hypothetical protein